MEDIDDILAEVIGDDVIPTETRDLRRLTRAWVNERASPELMPYPQDVMERVMNRIRRQVERVETETGQVDPKTNFQLIIIQTELERFKFLVRSFLRARIAKIDKYPLHLLSTSELSSRLSGPERRYLHQHQTLLHRHYLSSFLAGFPERLRRLDDTAGGISMIDRPNLDAAVLIRVLRDVNLPDPAATRPTVAPGGGHLATGEICVVRYHLVRDALSTGDVELL